MKVTLTHDGRAEFAVTIENVSGAGNNQPSRQNAANTGVDENGTVAVEESANAHVPSIAEMIRVTITTN